jgi:hypothetical protein
LLLPNGDTNFAGSTLPLLRDSFPANIPRRVEFLAREDVTITESVHAVIFFAQGVNHVG